MSGRDLLERHMGHWKSVRKSWKTAYAANEDRYKDSMEVLRGIFER